MTWSPFKGARAHTEAMHTTFLFIEIVSVMAEAIRH